MRNKYTPKKWAVIGSEAIKHHFPDFPRVPKDRDVIMLEKDYPEFISAESVISGRTILEEITGKHNNLLVTTQQVTYTTSGEIESIKQFTQEIIFIDNNPSLQVVLEYMTDDNHMATPKALYSLKKGHIHFPVKFSKHIGDLMFLRNKLSDSKQISSSAMLNSPDDLIDTYPALTQLHFTETEQRLGKLKTPRMDQSTEEFFGKSKKYVKSYYVHDDMHLAVAYPNKPVYFSILKEGSEVETDEHSWKDLSLASKINCVLEEVYVIALERKILPQMFENIPATHDEKSAFDWALMRVCTTLCDGFFREFAVRAYSEIQNSYDPGYVAKFFHNIKFFDKNDN